LGIDGLPYSGRMCAGSACRTRPTRSAIISRARWRSAPPASQFVMMTAAWPLVAVELGGAHDEPACRGSAARGPRVRRRGPSDRALGLDLHVRILRHRDGGFDQEVRAMGSLKIMVSLLVLAVETVNAKEGEWSAMVVQHPLRLSPDECLISLFWSHVCPRSAPIWRPRSAADATFTSPRGSGARSSPT
jgi:hypothetical protein